MRIPFGTLTLTDRAKELVRQALDSGRLTSGHLVREFEDRYAEKVGAKYAVAVSSGTDALACALMVLYEYGAKRGHVVVLPALSFPATGNAVLQAGFRPVFLDVNRHTLTLDWNTRAAWTTFPSAAIWLPVHLMGKPAVPPQYFPTTGPVIYDAAEAHGAKSHGQDVGSLGNMTCYSLYLAHIITTVEGGIITTNNEDYAAILRSIRQDGRRCDCRECVLPKGIECLIRWYEGQDRRFQFPRIGLSCKMNELEAAVGLGSLDEYDHIIETRHRNLKAMMKVVDETPGVFTFKEEPHERIGPHAVPILVEDGLPFSRDDLSRHLQERGIDTRNLFLSMPTQCGGFAFLGHKLGEFPEAEYVGTHGLHIGVHQDIGPSEIEYFAETLQQFVRQDKWASPSPETKRQSG